nr:unnamed protein product [Naegleria fowleri]
MKDLIRKYQSTTITTIVSKSVNMNSMEAEISSQNSDTDEIANPYLEICKCWNEASDKLEIQADKYLFGYTGQYLPDTHNDVPIRYPDTVLNIEQAFLICDMRLDWAMRNNQSAAVLNKYNAHLGRLLHSTIYNKESCITYELSITPTIFASWFNNKIQRGLTGSSNSTLIRVERFIVPEWFCDMSTKTLREELPQD